MANDETILVVEDNRSLREGIARNLRLVGYSVHTASDGETGMRSAFSLRPDLIVLDIMLPGPSGLDILSELRCHDRDVAVLILSGRDRTEHKIEGLRTGADDYLAKPFELEELLARVEAVLRRRRPEDEPPVVFGDVELHRNRRQVLLRGSEVELSAKELGVLSLLAERPGYVRTREEILDRVWGWDFDGSPRTVDNFIVSLRQKLEEDPARPRHILTVRGVGYKLALGSP